MKMLSQLCIRSVVQTYTCITGFIWPLSDLEYITFVQRFSFPENASLAKIEFVNLKPEKWKTQKLKRGCKWFSVWETCMNIVMNSLLCSAPNLAAWLQKGITCCPQYTICKIGTCICDTEKPMQWSCSTGEESSCLSPQINNNWDRWRCKPYRPSWQKSNTIFHQQPRWTILDTMQAQGQKD